MDRPRAVTTGGNMITLQPTVVLGIGQRGIEALEYLKARIGETYEELPGVKLLGISIEVPQTAGGSSGQERQTNLAGNELLPLPAGELLDATQQQLLETYPWLSADVFQAEADWTQTRAWARMVWHANFAIAQEDIYRYLVKLSSIDTINEMSQKGFQKDPQFQEANLIVLADLGDVVGSGLLFDLTYLFYTRFQRNGLQPASTGIMFLPSANHEDVVASEARAYATLKELDAYMSRSRSYSCEYPHTDIPVKSLEPPFNHGCYLVGTQNERALALRSDEEAAKLVGEWLFRSLLSPLKENIDSFVTEQGVVAEQKAQYSSLGLTVEVLPIAKLIHYSADRLSDELITDELLRPIPYKEVSDRLAAFLARTNLHPDSLIEQKLNRDENGKPVRVLQGEIEQLRRTDLLALPGIAQSVLRKARSGYIPEHSGQIMKNARSVVQEINDQVDQEIKSILGDYPSGGLSMASQFAAALANRAELYRNSLKRKNIVYQTRQQQLKNEEGRLGAMIEKAVAGIPPLWMIIMAGVMGVFAPITLTILWITYAEGVSLTIRAVSALLVLLLSVGIVFYVIWHTRDSIEKVRGEYITYIESSVRNELDQILTGEAEGVYPDVIKAAKRQAEAQANFSFMLHELAVQFKVRAYQQKATLCGVIDFTLQRSVLNEKLIDRLYSQFLGKGGTASRLPDLIAATKPLTEWDELQKDDIAFRVYKYCENAFGTMRDLHVQNMLKETDLDSPVHAEAYVNILRDKAAPLCTCNEVGIGQMAVADRQTLVGSEPLEGNDLVDRIKRLIPRVEFKSTTDRHSLVLTTIRRRIPLAAFIRLEDFRQRYLDRTRACDAPLHLESHLALTTDLMPRAVAGDTSTHLTPDVAFTLAHANGYIQFVDGIYTVVNSQGKVMRKLTSRLLESAVLFGVNEGQMEWIEETAQTLAQQKGGSEVTEQLTAWIDQPDVPDWEKEAIRTYIKQF
jgi:hypothetical protein